MFNLGIDFGNSFISVSAFINGQADILELYEQSSMNGQYIMPVSAYLEEDSSFSVGTVAEKKRVINPLRYRNNFKKDLGSKVPYFIAGKEVHPDYLCKEVLRYVREKAIEKYGPELGKTVITYPSSFPVYKINLLKRAALMAGFRQVELVDDASAASAFVCYENNYPVGSVFLIYDLGGTTFNLTLKVLDSSGFRNIVPPVTLDFCGGLDFQRKLFNDLAAKNSKVYQKALVDNDIEVMAVMEEIAEGLKFRLDVEEDEEIRIEKLVGTGIIHYSIQRSEYENMTDEYVSTTVRLTHQALKNGNLSHEEIKTVIFVGGTTRMPYIRKRISGLLGKPVVTDDFPQMTVSMGAALIASEPDFFVKRTVEATCPIGTGSYVQLGEYLGEKIVWKIINSDDRGYIALADRILCFKAFDAFGEDTLFHQSKEEQEYGSGLWEFSSLRQWLNSSDKNVRYSHVPPDAAHVWFNAYAGEAGFLCSFNDRERRVLSSCSRKVLLPDSQGDVGTELHIFNSSIKNALTNYKEAYAKQIMDIVFLPSVRMVVEDLDSEYLAGPTQSAAGICEGTFGEVISVHEDCVYWLDTPCTANLESVRIVSTSGGIDKREACDGTVGVRPVIHLRSEICVVSGEGSVKSPYKVIR